MSSLFTINDVQQFGICCIFTKTQKKLKHFCNKISAVTITLQFLCMQCFISGNQISRNAGAETERLV